MLKDRQKMLLGQPENLQRLRIEEGAGEKTQKVKVLPTKHENLNLTLGTHMMERTDSHGLSYPLYICTMA